jgi:hypothetical protein
VSKKKVRYRFEDEDDVDEEEDDDDGGDDDDDDDDVNTLRDELGVQSVSSGPVPWSKNQPEEEFKQKYYTDIMFRLPHSMRERVTVQKCMPLHLLHQYVRMEMWTRPFRLWSAWRRAYIEIQEDITVEIAGLCGSVVIVEPIKET